MMKDRLGETSASARLRTLREQSQRRHRLLNQLAEDRRDLDLAHQERAQREVQLIKERADVEELTGFTLTSLFAWIRNDKEVRLTKEQAELVAAELSLQEQDELIADLTTQVEQGQVALAELPGDIDAQLAEAEAERAAEIRAASHGSGPGADRAQRLLEIEARQQEVEVALSDQKEILAEGRRAVKACEEVSRLLESAKSWGTWDLMGGGLIATLVKHNRLDEAKRAASRAGVAIRRFLKHMEGDRRLDGVGDRIQIGSGLKFADYLLDGLFIDWMVQARIGDSHRDVTATISTLRELCGGLEVKVAEQQSRLDAVIEEWRALVGSVES